MFIINVLCHIFAFPFIPWKEHIPYKPIVLFRFRVFEIDFILALKIQKVNAIQKKNNS